jgi:hypothetical protein
MGTAAGVDRAFAVAGTLAEQLGRNVGQGSLRLFSVGPLRLCRLRRAYRD